MSPVGALEELAARLADAERRRGRAEADFERFSRALSHDLEAPLRHVAKFARMIVEGRETESAGTLSEWCEIVEDGARRMQDLVHGLMAIAGALRSEPEPGGIDVAEAGRAALGEVRRESPRGPEPVLGLEGSPEIVASRPLFAAVLRQLFSNGVRFQAPDATPRIVLRVSERGSESLVEVEDNGIGIPERERERIFEAFRRLHPRDVYPGNGIGLAICRLAVERMGGRIWAEAAPGGGSRFSFTLPREDAPPAG